MFKMSIFSFDARRELAKAQNRFADCFIRQQLSDPLDSLVLVSAYYNLLELFYYYSVLLVNKILCHNDVPTKSNP